MTRQVWKQIKRDLDRNTLDFKYTVRKYLKEHPEEKGTTEYQALAEIANSAFDYLHQWSENIGYDKSLKTVTGLCSQRVLMKTVDYKDEQVFMLAELFNEMAHSARKNHRCYDCGTNARAVFLKLLEAYRGTYELGQNEIEQLRHTYKPVRGSMEAVIHAKTCFRKLKNMQNSGIVIMSIGLGDIGHVWVIEKFYTIQNKPIYRHYQSCLNSHMLIDFIEEMDYGARPQRTIDLESFEQALIAILKRDQQWLDCHYRYFCELFAFQFNQPITEPRPSFCYGLFEY